MRAKCRPLAVWNIWHLASEAKHDITVILHYVIVSCYVML